MRPSRAFTIVELLVVTAVVLLLIAMLVPSLARARLQARLVKVRGELYQLGVALETYAHVARAYPPAFDVCAGAGHQVEDYNHLPEELTLMRCIAGLPEDPFNAGRSYKYLAAGIARGNQGEYTKVCVWVPDGWPHYPREAEPDTGTWHCQARTSPVKWAVWSVGPRGPLRFDESKAARVPVPKRTWYRRGSGPRGPGVVALFRADVPQELLWSD